MARCISFIDHVITQQVSIDRLLRINNRQVNGKERSLSLPCHGAAQTQPHTKRGLTLLIDQYHMTNALPMYRMFECLVISLYNTVCNGSTSCGMCQWKSNCCTRTPIADYMQMYKRTSNADWSLQLRHMNSSTCIDCQQYNTTYDPVCILGDCCYYRQSWIQSQYSHEDVLQFEK